MARISPCGGLVFGGREISLFENIFVPLPAGSQEIFALRADGAVGRVGWCE